MMLITACLIVRDEEHNLPRCLPSLAGIADEVLVYDTGSVDATVEVARSLGARVVQGAWPGGFAEARNDALSHCSGEWILSLDADQAVRCEDSARLRARLTKASTRAVAYKVSIDNQTGLGTGSGYSHAENRLFRRTACRWRGRLHEQLVDHSTHQLVAAEHINDLRLDHWGYLEQNQRDTAKAERNLALAYAEVDDPSLGDRGIALVWLGRALWAADRPEEAIDVLAEGAATTSNPTSRRIGLETATRICLRIGRLDDAEHLLGDLAACSRSQVVVHLLRGGLFLARGDFTRALGELCLITGTSRDDDGREYGPRETLEWRAAALVGLGRAGHAADLLLDPLRRGGALGADLTLMTNALVQAGPPLDELVELLPDHLVPVVLAGALQMEPRTGNEVLEALWRAASPHNRVTVLAGGAMLARLLDPPAAAAWSRRLRDHGLKQLCPLEAVARDAGVPPAIRHNALAALGHGQDAPRASGTLDRSPAPETHELLEPPQLSVIVVAHGGVEQVHGCLVCLSTSLAGSRTFEVVIVDPATTDGTAALLADLGGDVKVLRLATDPGPAGARNVGARHARGEVLAFIDPAARVQAGWLDPIFDALKDDPNLGAVSPLVRHADRPDTEIAGASLTFGTTMTAPALGLAGQPWNTPSDLRDALAVSWLHDGRQPPDVLLGAAIVIRRTVFEAVGGYDERYWYGGEDFDLSQAVRAAGWSLAAVPGTSVVLDGPTAGPAAPWTAVDPMRLDFERSVGPRWQLLSNRRLFVSKWHDDSVTVTC